MPAAEVSKNVRLVHIRTGKFFSSRKVLVLWKKRVLVLRVKNIDALETNSLKKNPVKNSLTLSCKRNYAPYLVDIISTYTTYMQT